MTEERGKRIGQLLLDRLYLVLLAVAGVLLVFAVIAQPDLSLLTGWWHIQLSEAGLITDPMATGGVGSALLNAALILLICTLLMFIGAAPGGTGGGVKVTTFTVMILTVAAVLHGREDPVLRERRVDKKTVYRAMTIITLALGVLLCTTLFMVFDTPVPGGRIDDNLIDCLFEAASAFGTVGLSSGVTAMLGPTVKVITSLTMLIGRVGPISMGMTLAAQTSELTRREVLPEAKIVVG